LGFENILHNQGTKPVKLKPLSKKHYSQQLEVLDLKMGIFPQPRFKRLGYWKNISHEGLMPIIIITIWILFHIMGTLLKDMV
jgi:hypothetical protein